MPAKNWKGSKNNILGKKYNKKFNEDTKLDISEKLQNQIIRASNQELANIIIAGEDGVRLPKGLGVIVVSKYKTKKLAPDFHTSKKVGKKVYYTNLHTYGYQFKIKWYRVDSTMLAFGGIYKFKACRLLSRAVAAHGKKTNGSTYFSWEYADFKKQAALEAYMLKKFKKEKYE